MAGVIEIEARVHVSPREWEAALERTRKLHGTPAYERRLTQIVHYGAEDGLRSVTSFDDHKTVWECKRTLGLFRFAHWAYYVASETPCEPAADTAAPVAQRIKTTTRFAGISLSTGPATYTVEFVDTVTAGHKMHMIEIELEGDIAVSEFGFQDDEFVPSVDALVRNVLLPDRVWPTTIYGELMAMRIAGKMMFPITQAQTLSPSTPIAKDTVVMYKHDGSRALLVVWGDLAYLVYITGHEEAIGDAPRRLVGLVGGGRATVIDCEVCGSDVYALDLVMTQNEVVTEKPFAERRALLLTMLGPDGRVAIGTHRLQAIETYPGGMYRELFGKLDPTKHDGVCFKLAGVYAGSVIKFKPQALQSIDFVVHPGEPSGDGDRHCVLKVGSRDGLVPFASTRVPCCHRLTRGCIAEFRYEVGRFQFVKMRPDKTKPNTEYVANVTFDDMQHEDYQGYYCRLLDEKLGL